MTDPLDILKSASICPNCHAITRLGMSKCPECGTFHSTIHLDERVPTAEDLKPHQEREVEPSMYSLNPGIGVEQSEEFDDVEDVTTEWKGGSADFNFDEEDEKSSPSTKITSVINEETIIDD